MGKGANIHRKCERESKGWISHSDSEGHDGKAQASASNAEFFLYEGKRDFDLEATVGSKRNAEGVQLQYRPSTSPVLQGKAKNEE